ncbi:glycosyl transferase family 1 [Paenibacillus selenitireducens]|uniref:Glycosyl transferase family 1 n=1 Tax=Paenibacillus selenitireducens TaxID=1324314 RepID=A0A1T2XK63_9BACL|nr:glycosyltransferase family 1 protein [Paenibacillus selenitireducens]OPA80202.1 glycosyl transferase family 1 [Paenibacillus selenitireducens]
MRILIWCANLISLGGGARLLSNLLPAMARQNDIDLVRLIISPETKFKDRIELSSYPNIEVIYFEGSLQSPSGLSFLSDCHVVYFFWPHGPEYQQVDRPTICTYHDTTVLDFVPPYLSGSTIKKYWEISKAWVENVTSVIVSSQYMKTRLIEHFGAHCQNTVVIPHAISPAKPEHGGTVISSDLAARLPAAYIVYPSNISPHKNHYNLLLAYSKFSLRKKVPLVLFGYLTQHLRNVPPDWPELQSLPTLVSLIKRLDLRLDEDFFPLGFIRDEDVMPVLEQAKALIMPSMSEGGGSYPVEEALRLGTPVLCSDIPVMREHMANHSAEIVWFDPESPDSILQALESMTLNYDHFKQSAVKGINDPSETWDDIAQKYIHVFRTSYLKFHGQL